MRDRSLPQIVTGTGEDMRGCTHLSLPEPGRNWRTGDTGGTRSDKEEHRRLVEQVSIHYRYSNTESPQRMNEIGQ